MFSKTGSCLLLPNVNPKTLMGSELGDNGAASTKVLNPLVWRHECKQIGEKRREESGDPC